MKTIFKFAIPITDLQVVNMPEGAEVLTAQMQGSELCLWALVDPEADRKPRQFRIAGTGHKLPADPGAYIGTAQMHGGQLVWHVFEVRF